jgi:hypothetical protein
MAQRLIPIQRKVFFPKLSEELEEHLAEKAYNVFREHATEPTCCWMNLDDDEQEPWIAVAKTIWAQLAIKAEAVKSRDADVSLSPEAGHRPAVDPGPSA